MKLCEFDMLKVLLWNCKSVWLWICCVFEKLLSVCITNWFIRALNQFISLLHLISPAPRFNKVFQIVKTIFKGLNWEKSFKVQFSPPLELSLKRFQRGYWSYEIIPILLRTFDAYYVINLNFPKPHGINNEWDHSICKKIMGKR